MTTKEIEAALIRLLNEYYMEKDREYHVRVAKTYPYVSELIGVGDRLFATGEKWLSGQLAQKQIK